MLKCIPFTDTYFICSLNWFKTFRNHKELVSCNIFIYYIVLHNPINNSSRLPVSDYIHAIIISVHYLELTKKPYSSPYNNTGKRSWSLHKMLEQFFFKDYKIEWKKQLSIKSKNILKGNFNKECSCFFKIVI
jgi:hypothetical protein